MNGRCFLGLLLRRMGILCLLGWNFHALQAQQTVTFQDSLYCHLQTRLEIAANIEKAKDSQLATDTLMAALPDFDLAEGIQFDRLLSEYYYALGYSAFYLADFSWAKRALSLSDSLLSVNQGPGDELRARLRRIQGAVAYFADGNAFKAQKRYEEAYLEWLKIGRIDSAEFAIVLQYMGQAAGRLGEYDKSVDLYNQSLLVRESYYGKEHWRVGWTHWYLGNTHFFAEKYSDAVNSYQKALGILQVKTPNDGRTIGNIKCNLAISHYWLNDLEASISISNEALRLLQINGGAQSTDLVFPLGNQAMAYAKLGQMKDAHKCIQKGFAICEYHKIHTGPILAGVLSSQALVAEAEYGASIETIERVQDAIRAVAPSMQGKGLYEYPSASETMDPVLLQNYALFKAQMLLAYALKSADAIPELEAAKVGFKLVGDLSDRLRLAYEDQDDKLALSDRGTVYLEDALTCAYKLWTLTNDPGQIEQAFRFMERNKFQLLLELFKKSQLQIAGEIGETELNHLDSLRRRGNEIDFALSQGAVSEDSEGVFRAELLNLRIEIAQMEDTFKQKSRIFNTLNNSSQDTASLTAFQASLPNDHIAALSYVQTDSSLFVLACTKSKIFFRSSPLPLGFVDSLNTWLELCHRVGTTPREIQTFTRLGHKLFEILVAPELKALDPTIHELLLIPDGILGALPFEALLSESAPENANYGNLAYLIHQYQIHYGASASLWMAQHAMAQQMDEQSCLGVAWGDVDRVQLEGIAKPVPSLPGTNKEVESIGDLVEGKYLKEAEATESAFKTLAPQFGLLHLALHARVLKDPQILFPSGGNATEDGILHFHELFQMRLKARMAVLSACETGLGELKRGEGIQSMSSGFAAAGIPTLLVSLWEVNDKSGATIMQDFYKGITSGAPVDQALRQAKLDYLEDASGYEAAPFYWSTMVPLGNMDPIQVQRKTAFNTILFGTMGGLLLCIFIIFSIYRKKQLST